MRWKRAGRLIDGQILVSKGTRSGEPGLRLVHEAAATAWPRCVEWLDEFRARHRWQLGLRTAAEQWRDRGRNEGAHGAAAPLTRLPRNVGDFGRPAGTSALLKRSSSMSARRRKIARR